MPPLTPHTGSDALPGAGMIHGPLSTGGASSRGTSDPVPSAGHDRASTTVAIQLVAVRESGWFMGDPPETHYRWARACQQDCLPLVSPTHERWRMKRPRSCLGLTGASG